MAVLKEPAYSAREVRETSPISGRDPLRRAQQPTPGSQPENPMDRVESMGSHTVGLWTEAGFRPPGGACAWRAKCCQSDEQSDSVPSEPPTEEARILIQANLQ